MLGIDWAELILMVFFFDSFTQDLRLVRIPIALYVWCIGSGLKCLLFFTWCWIE
jgi:hypothetical protein